MVEERFKSDIKVPSMSVNDIKEKVKIFRKKLRIDKNEKISICKILELYNYMIKPKNEMEDNIHAYLERKTNKIVVREDVYDSACYWNNGRDRDTIAHEIGHLNLEHYENIIMNRDMNAQLKPYESAEWQAKVYSGELLCPSWPCLCRMKIKTIADKYGVSLECAEYQKNRSLNLFNKKGDKK